MLLARSVEVAAEDVTPTNAGRNELYLSDRVTRDGGEIAQKFVEAMAKQQVTNKARGYVKFEIPVDHASWPALKPQLAAALSAAADGIERSMVANPDVEA